MLKCKVHASDVNTLDINAHFESKNPQCLQLIKYEKSSRKCNQPQCEIHEASHIRTQ